MAPSSGARWATLWAALAALQLLGCDPSHKFKGTRVDPPTDAPEIVGVNWDESDFRLSDLQGKVIVLFFGYTYCPDICPFTLSRMKQLEVQLEALASDLEVVFVSVDPERDSSERLAGYVPGFKPDFFGLHLKVLSLMMPFLILSHLLHLKIRGML